MALDPATGPQAAIEVTDLSKKYTLLHGGARSVKDAVVKRLLRRLPAREEVWALRDLDMRVEPGEAVGVIGPNGSGKTTLLGVLGGVLVPTKGHVSVRGRVCVLLEAGAAFHPDFSGLENVFLTGAVLGMSRSEVSDKLESILDFAGAGDHIDAPLRTYSLGMSARLGFSVAVHMDPDVLLMDEILAVVDRAFHESCYERLRELRAGGCTVVFVSHVSEQISAVCDRVVWLEKGRSVGEGPTEEILERYARQSSDGSADEGAGAVQ